MVMVGTTKVIRSYPGFHCVVRRLHYHLSLTETSTPTTATAEKQHRYRMTGYERCQVSAVCLDFQ
jgi:hypothetical protein